MPKISKYVRAPKYDSEEGSEGDSNGDVVRLVRPIVPDSDQETKELRRKVLELENTIADLAGGVRNTLVGIEALTN
ncbi:hypothetical protein ZHAS_00007126 [Anopheles sinensis]|uniref:Uncharacterized protein n=1 Tax=Anopheles sinensis TaxID=74873 RepID=A0A084VNT9_ANOSI|nr:hypothetical protein ZHAS_00007126 [Anopheles sinensis]